jgi:hypothetical protein
MAAPVNGQSCLHSVAGARTGVGRSANKRGGRGSPASDRPAKGRNTQTSVANQLTQQVKTYELTKIYTKGRDKEYEDANALARFNTWVRTNEAKLDPSEQHVCQTCGNVGFELCIHSIRHVDAEQEPTALDMTGGRHHQWKFPWSREILRKVFVMPQFDTLSYTDEALHGFSNKHLSDDLILPKLYQYLVFNMQTSYRVNGNEDRDLRLSHCHRLAQKWVIENDQRTNLEDDAHFAVRLRLTVQRACDNQQNNMLYEERDPRRNFGLAWLPKTVVGWLVLACVLLYVVCHPSITLGLLLRFVEVAYQSACLITSILSYLVVSVPGLVPRIFVSASTHQAGSVSPFLCVQRNIMRVSNETIAHDVIQSCNYMDWLTVEMTEVFYHTSDILAQTWKDTTKFRDEQCLDLAAKQLVLDVVQESARLMPALISWTEHLQLFWQQLMLIVQRFLYRC